MAGLLFLQGQIDRFTLVGYILSQEEYPWHEVPLHGMDTTIFKKN